MRGRQARQCSSTGRRWAAQALALLEESPLPAREVWPPELSAKVRAYHRLHRRAPMLHALSVEVRVPMCRPLPRHSLIGLGRPALTPPSVELAVARGAAPCTVLAPPPPAQRIGLETDWGVLHFQTCLHGRCCHLRRRTRHRHLRLQTVELSCPSDAPVAHHRGVCPVVHHMARMHACQCTSSLWLRGQVGPRWQLPRSSCRRHRH